MRGTWSTYADTVRVGPKVLGAGERVVFTSHAHGKALVWPSICLITLGGAVGAGAGLVPSGWRPAGQVAVALAGAAVAVWWALLPYLRWRSTTYTLTTRRLIVRRGVLRKAGMDVPLIRVQGAFCRRGLLDRVLGCGNLHVQTATEGGIVLVGVPDVKRVHLEITELLTGKDADARRAS